jgi:hypothetical protein
MAIAGADGFQRELDCPRAMENTVITAFISNAITSIATINPTRRTIDCHFLIDCSSKKSTVKASRISSV